MPEKTLIIDDDLDTLHLLGLMLQPEGYQVLAASDGAQGLNVAARELPDVILLDIMMPIMGHATLESIRLMASGVRAFVDFCAEGLKANVEKCEASVEQSLSMVTSLNPLIGYERAASLAKEAFHTGKTIRQLCREQGVLPENTLNEALDPWRMTEPQA